METKYKSQKRGSSEVGMLFFSQKIMNMFALVHSFGMQMVEFCEKNYNINKYGKITLH